MPLFAFEPWKSFSGYRAFVFVVAFFFFTSSRPHPATAFYIVCVYFAAYIHVQGYLNLYKRNTCAILPFFFFWPFFSPLVVFSQHFVSHFTIFLGAVVIQFLTAMLVNRHNSRSVRFSLNPAPLCHYLMSILFVFSSLFFFLILVLSTALEGFARWFNATTNEINGLYAPAECIKRFYGLFYSYCIFFLPS